MTSLEKFIQEQTENDLLVAKQFPDYHNLDGVANPSKYLSLDTKVLFVMKEANDYYESMRLLHSNTDENVIRNYSQWKRSYKKLLYVAHGILTDQFDWDGMQDFKMMERLTECFISMKSDL